MKPGGISIRHMDGKYGTYKVARHTSYCLGQGHKYKRECGSTYIPGDKAERDERETILVDIPDASHLWTSSPVRSRGKSGQDRAEVKSVHTALLLRCMRTRAWIHETCREGSDPFVPTRPIEWVFWVVRTLPVDNLLVIVRIVLLLVVFGMLSRLLLFGIMSWMSAGAFIKSVSISWSY